MKKRKGSYVVCVCIYNFSNYRYYSFFAINHEKGSQQPPYTPYIPSSSENYSVSTSNRKPKISAEVSDDLYDEVQSYCRKNSITVSDLIRKSVKSFMENN